MTQPNPPPSTPGGIEDVYPLSALQQGMLLESRLAPGSGVYWVQVGLLLEGGLDLGVFLGAWEAAVVVVGGFVGGVGGCGGGVWGVGLRGGVGSGGGAVVGGFAGGGVVVAG